MMGNDTDPTATVQFELPTETARALLADNEERVEALIEDARADGRDDIADKAERLLAEVRDGRE